MNTQTLHISKGAFKLENINSISTNTLTNEYCIKQKDNKDIICGVCYSWKGLNFRKSMINVLEKNSNLLSNSIIEWDNLPRIFDLYFRFSSHGELINEIHLENLNNICLKNPKTNFTLWSKRFDIVKKFYDNNDKPSNLILIYSNPKFDKPLNKLPKYFDKTFNNVIKLSYKKYFTQHTMFFQKNEITKEMKTKIKNDYDNYINTFDKDNNINCFQKCKDCLLCYTKNNVKTIIEKAK
tara:strand:+ start:40 stop:753 length:714 start_codon:yes stop_codon:yes gene_type:complete